MVLASSFCLSKPWFLLFSSFLSASYSAYAWPVLLSCPHIVAISLHHCCFLLRYVWRSSPYVTTAHLSFNTCCCCLAITLSSPFLHRYRSLLPTCPSLSQLPRSVCVASSSSSLSHTHNSHPRLVLDLGRDQNLYLKFLNNWFLCFVEKVSRGRSFLHFSM